MDRIRPRAAAETAIDDFELTEFAQSAAGRLSGGWARRLQLAAALIHSPRLILLDEPTAGLDPVSRHEVWRRIGRLAAQGAGVIVSTHDLAEAERCSRAALLSEGKIVAAGTPEQIARSTSADAFLLSGTEARQLARLVETVQGVIASYPTGTEPARCRRRGSGRRSASYGGHQERQRRPRGDAARGCCACVFQTVFTEHRVTTAVRWYCIGGRFARTLAVARVEILHLIHDRTTISLILLVPAIQIVLFGYAVNLDPRHVPIAVAGDQDGRERIRSTASSEKPAIS